MKKNLFHLDNETLKMIFKPNIWNENDSKPRLMRNKSILYKEIDICLLKVPDLLKFILNVKELDKSDKYCH